MEFDNLLDMLFHVGGAGSLAIFGLLMWLDMRTSVKKIAESLDTLTVQMAKVVERVDSHEKRIDKLEDK